MVLRLCYSGGGGNKSGYNKGKHQLHLVIVCIIYILISLLNKQEQKQTFPTLLDIVGHFFTEKKSNYFLFIFAFLLFLFEKFSLWLN